MKRWYQSKTIWANLAGIVGAAGAYFSGDAAAQSAAVPAAVMALANLVLRLTTSQPIGAEE